MKNRPREEQKERRCSVAGSYGVASVNLPLREWQSICSMGKCRVARHAITSRFHNEMPSRLSRTLSTYGRTLFCETRVEGR